MPWAIRCVLGAWSCAFCTSEDLDVKYFFEPKVVFLKFCVHVDFIVFLWITSFESKINVLSVKRFCIVINRSVSAWVWGAAGF